MDNYIISPDDCLILRAFKKASSLREAAKILNCDPAGLQRKTQRISEEYGLLQKIDGRWGLTEKGLLLVGWLEESINSQSKMLQQHSSLKIASTMWLAEQLIIPNLSRLKKFKNFNISVPNGDFQKHLITGAADFVIVCHPPEDPAIAHKQLFKEDWVVISPVSFKNKNHKLKIEDLQNRPFIRHAEMNPDIFLLRDISLKTDLVIDNLIGVRSAVLNNLGWSIVPRVLVHDLLKDKKILEVDYKIDMDRKICVWWLRRRSEMKKLSTDIALFVQEAIGHI